MEVYDKSTKTRGFKVLKDGKRILTHVITLFYTQLLNLYVHFC